VRFRLVLVIAAVATFGLAASAHAQDKAAIDKGKKVYDTATPKCSVCHAIAGAGKATSPLDSVGAKMTADEIRAWITDPKAQAAKAKKPATMPAYSKLTKDDVDNLVAYLSSLKKK